MDGIPERFPAASLPPDTHLLALNPPLLGLNRLAEQYVAHGLDAGEGCIVVTTEQETSSLVETLAHLAPDAAFDRLGIVDATGQEPGEVEHPCRVESASSPADLTGIGIALSKLLDAFEGMDVPGYRVAVESVSSLLVYAGFERVYQFLHTVTNQIDKLDGSSISLISADIDQTEIRKFESLFDGLVESRDTDDGLEYRVQWSGGEGDWRPLAAGERQSPADSEPTPGRPASTGEPVVESPTSLSAIIDAIDTTGLTLTLCNYGGSDDVEDDLRAYFERLNVAVRTATLSTETPANVALLHRESDVFATSPVAELHAAISLDALESDEDLTALVRPDVLDHVHRREYSVSDGTKLELVRISRLIETRALEAGRGTLHTGFQRLNRVDDGLGTLDLYEAIARAGVTVHLYGRPGDLPNEDLYTLHTAETGELADSWFVAYDGGGQDGRKAAELCRETSSNRYTGVWTYQPEVVDTVLSYLETTYGGA